MARIARGEEVDDRAMKVIATAVTVEQLRQVQAIVLALRSAMSLEQTAEVTGLALPFIHNYFHPELSKPRAKPMHIICRQV